MTLIVLHIMMKLKLRKIREHWKICNHCKTRRSKFDERICVTLESWNPHCILMPLYKRVLLALAFVFLLETTDLFVYSLFSIALLLWFIWLMGRCMLQQLVLLPGWWCLHGSDQRVDNTAKNKKLQVSQSRSTRHRVT